VVLLTFAAVRFMRTHCVSRASEPLSLRGVAVNFFDWHKRQTDWWLQKLGISDYAALWVAYIKGAVTAVVVLWLLGYL